MCYTATDKIQSNQYFDSNQRFKPLQKIKKKKNIV